MSIACTIHGKLDLRLQDDAPPALGPHDVLLGLGAGGIFGSDLHCFKEGAMRAMAARLAGAADVTVCDVHDGALDLARRVGADRVVRGDQTDVAALADSADVTIEAAGSAIALQTCLTAVKRGGRVIQVGTLPAELPFPANSVMQRELDYRGVFRAHLAFDWAVQAIRGRRVDVRPLITAQLPLAEARAAFELALDKTRSTKVQVVAAGSAFDNIKESP